MLMIKKPKKPDFGSRFKCSIQGIIKINISSLWTKQALTIPASSSKPIQRKEHIKFYIIESS